MSGMVIFEYLMRYYVKILKLGPYSRCSRRPTRFDFLKVVSGPTFSPSHLSIRHWYTYESVQYVFADVLRDLYVVNVDTDLCTYMFKMFGYANTINRKGVNCTIGN